jgi:hypothetical protein
MGYPTLLDIVKANGNDAMVGLVDESLKLHPEVGQGASRTMKGTSYRTRVRTALSGTDGSFRDANAGTTRLSHTYENRLVECFISEPRIEVDKAVADAYEDGAQAYIAIEAAGALEATLQGLGKSFFYGRNATFGNAKGFPGLIDSVAAAMVIDAGGTTDNVGSSVWFVSFGPQAVQWVWGLNGQLGIGPVRIESIIDPNDSTKKFDGYVTSMLCRPGLQVANIFSVCRIKKLTTDSGKGFTPALAAQALQKFQENGRPAPQLAFATPRSLEQYRASLTSYSTEGTPVQPVTNAFGIPIFPTTSLSNIETLAL